MKRRGRSLTRKPRGSRRLTSSVSMSTSRSRSPYARAPATAGGWRSRNLGLKNMRTGGLLGIEYKFLDFALGSSVLLAPTDATGGNFDPTGVGCTGCLSAPAVGDGPQNRDGYKIVMLKLHVFGTITCIAQAAVAALDNVPDVMIAIVLDTQTNGAQAASNTIYTTLVATAAGATQPMRLMSNTTRFKVLKSKRFHLHPPLVGNDAATTMAQSATNTQWKMNINLGKLPVRFTQGSSTADVANVVDNSLHLIAYCSDVNMAPNIQYHARLRFVG